MNRPSRLVVSPVILHPNRHPVRRIVTLTALLMVASIAEAQPEMPRLRSALVGFNGQFRNRHWTPLTVDVENPGPACTALITVESPGAGAGQRVQFTRPAFLPAESNRRFEFPILPDIRPSPTAGRVQLGRVVSVKLTDGALRTWGQNEALGNPVPEEAFFLLVVDSDFDGYRGLRDLFIGTERRPFARALTPPRAMPRRPLELRGFDAMVLGGLAETELTPLQLRAIRDYVESGGHLLVLPSAMPGISPALAELLPGTFVSTQRVETLPPVAGGFIFTNGLTIARLAPGECEVLVGTRDRPWILSRREGVGRVTMIGFEAGREEFSVWPGSVSFWRDLLGGPPQFLHHSDRLLARSPDVERVLASLAGFKVMSRRGVLLYLCAAAGGLLLVLALFRFTSRPEWGWPVAVMLAIAAGVGAISATARWKSAPQPLLNEVFVTTSTSGGDSGRVQAMLGLFSPVERRYSIHTGSDGASLTPGRSATTPPELFALGYEERLSVSNLAVRADDLRAIAGSGPATGTRSPNVRARVSADGLTLSVSNRAGAPLSGAFVKFNRFVVPLGDVQPHAQVDRAGLRGNPRATTTGLLRSARDAQRERLRGVLFPAPEYAAEVLIKADERRFQRLLRGREPLPVLFSWSDEPAFPIASIDPPIPRRAVGLLAVDGTVDYDGPVLHLPAGLMPVQLRNTRAQPFERGAGCFAGGRAAHLAVEFTLPAGCPALHAQELTVHFEFRGAAFEPDVFVAPGDFKLPEDVEHAVSRMERVGTSSPLRVPDPARFLHAGVRSVFVVVRVAYSAEGRKLDLQINPNIHTWQLRELDLEVKGLVP
ncbi:MAG: hypothetical protein FJ386_14030 [Verrucomicrobia bacterium]|nr:hypothetical protein [Verrucomicrobiota bacterium]